MSHRPSHDHCGQMCGILDPVGYDEVLAERLREVLSSEGGLSEQKMFGGLAFMLHGHMAVAASGQGGLMLRIDPATSDDLTRREGVSLVHMAGRSMSGWLHIEPDVVQGDEALAQWVGRGVEYVRVLPPKR